MNHNSAEMTNDQINDQFLKRGVNLRLVNPRSNGYLEGKSWHFSNSGLPTQG